MSTKRSAKDAGLEELSPKRRKLNLYDVVPVEAQQMIAGFFDGDGSLILHWQRQSNTATGYVSFGQACAQGTPPELSLIQQYYGGYISKSAKPLANQRQCYQLRVQGTAFTKLFSDLQKHSILKQPQLHFVKSYLADRKNAIPDEIKKQFKQMKTLTAYQAVSIDVSRLTPAYIGGLLTAEGYITIRNHKKRKFCIEANIAQKSNMGILEEINRLYGGIGSRPRFKLSFFGKASCKTFLSSIQKYVFGIKRKQVDIALQYCDYQKQQEARSTDEEVEQFRKWAIEIKRLKKT